MRKREPGLPDRIDRVAGRIWSRVGGTIFLLVGLGALTSMVATDGFTLAAYWPGLAICSLFFLASWACFRSQAGLLETLSDAPTKRRD